MESIVITMVVSLFVKYGTGLDCPQMYLSAGDVCGTDGVTYPSLCELEIARIFDSDLDIQYFGSCTTFCDNQWKPVCGTDLKTYQNLCKLEFEARKNEDVDFLYWGECVYPASSEPALENYGVKRETLKKKPAKCESDSRTEGSVQTCKVYKVRSLRQSSHNYGS